MSYMKFNKSSEYDIFKKKYIFESSNWDDDIIIYQFYNEDGKRKKIYNFIFRYPLSYTYKNTAYLL